MLTNRFYALFLFVFTFFLCAGCSGGTGASADAAADSIQDLASDLGDQGSADGTDGAEIAGDTSSANLEEQEQILAVPESKSVTIPGLTSEVYVVRTEGNVPHVYASNRNDLGLVLGFILAQDRYFVMDLQRRLGQGSVSALIGDNALETDQESRGIGMTYLTDRLMENLSPSLTSYMESVTAGINLYIEQVREGSLPAPSELEVALPLLGADNAADLMQPWVTRDIAAMVAVVMYETNYETGDISRTARAQYLKSLYSDGGAFSELRKEGFLSDVAYNAGPFLEVTTTPGFGIHNPGAPAAPEAGSERGAQSQPSASPKPRAVRVPLSMLTRLSDQMEGLQKRLLRNHDAGFGSNTWAVSGAASTDGAALVAGDGHLPLSMPPLMYQVGLNTRTFGGGAIDQKGLLMTSLPVLAVGTNGKVAWSQVNPVVDVTDWYAEELTLDADGAPQSSLFQGEQKDLVSSVEDYEIADLPALGSTGRTESWTRWETFDGRWIAEIEGRAASADEVLAQGETLVNLRGHYVVPGDQNDDGVISAVSFDHTGFDATAYLDALDKLGFAQDVYEYQDATKGLVGSGLFSAVGDDQGNIFFTSYQGIPCRGYLARNEDNSFVEGANPTMLLDGTTYGAFMIPMKDGVVDEAPGATDAYRCVVPFEAMPQSINPEQGYVMSANNDPGKITWDGGLHDDDWYIGGPWYPTRGYTIDMELVDAVATDTADLNKMSEIQGNKDSRLGAVFAPYLIDAIKYAQAIEPDPQEAHDVRILNLYNSKKAALDDVAARLEQWLEQGYRAASGVETFYNAPTEKDREDAVATMIFNAYMGRFMRLVFDDEPLGQAWLYNSSRMQVRSLRLFLQGRGADNPGQLASWHVDTQEAIFFDILETPEVERSSEIMLMALIQGLEFLESPPVSAGSGGFGTADMSTWLWGLRHQVRFESLLSEFLGDDPAFGFLADLFSLTTQTLPLAQDIEADDPRNGIKWFPRGGDQWNVDAANPGFSGTQFTHANGPVMRMVISLKDGKVNAKNIIPGGQSALIESEHYADQAKKWLANETIPMHFHVEDIAEAALSRERYTPAQ